MGVGGGGGGCSNLPQNLAALRAGAEDNDVSTTILHGRSVDASQRGQNYKSVEEEEA